MDKDYTYAELTYEEHRNTFAQDAPGWSNLSQYHRDKWYQITLPAYSKVLNMFVDDHK